MITTTGSGAGLFGGSPQGRGEMDEKVRKVIIARDCTAASAKSENRVVHRGEELTLSETDARTLVGIGKAYFLDGKNMDGKEVADPARDRAIADIRRSLGKDAQPKRPEAEAPDKAQAKAGAKK